MIYWNGKHRTPSSNNYAFVYISQFDSNTVVRNGFTKWLARFICRRLKFLERLISCSDANAILGDFSIFQKSRLIYLFPWWVCTEASALNGRRHYLRPIILFHQRKWNLTWNFTFWGLSNSVPFKKLKHETWNLTFGRWSLARVWITFEKKSIGIPCNERSSDTGNLAQTKGQWMRFQVKKN